MSARVAVGWLAGLVLAVGILLGNAHHSVAGIDCGAAFTPIDAGLSACSDALLVPRVASFTLFGVGVLTLLFLGLTGMQRGRVELPERVSEPS